ncbi:hypothetical protein SK128_023991, partial [Halocaridina rubra]
QVHPADLGVCGGAPYARRSLERGGGGGGGRRPKSPPVSPTTHATAYPPSTTPPHIAYPITPNLCVTAGKIEFITPPDSTLSSTASRCSTLKLSPTIHHTKDEKISPTYAHPYNTTSHAPVHHRPPAAGRHHQHQNQHQNLQNGSATSPLSTLSKSSTTGSYSSPREHEGKNKEDA